MSTPRPDPADEFRWFEALGGSLPAEDNVADALMLRRLLAPGKAAPAALQGMEISWPRLRQRLLDELAAEDREWFEAVGGDTDMPSAGRGEGRRLRSALAVADETEPAPVNAAATQAELMRRLASLAPPAPVSHDRRRGWLSSLFGQGTARPGWAVAAILALVVGIGVVVQQETPEHERERGVAQVPRIGPTGAPTFDVADPQAEAQRLVQALGSAGVNADLKAEAGYWVVRALWPDPAGAAAERLLRERQLEVPPDRLLEVVFVGKR